MITAAVNNELTAAKCRLCDRTFGKRQMTNHLKACWEHHPIAVPGKATAGVVFSHQYDFGTTTELALRVAGEHTAPALAGGLKLLARNEPPAIPCSVCAKPATQVCRRCAEEGAAGLCDACAGRHDCGEEMLAPLINSPRTGVCGYCGPSVEP
jgi:hypothetical protein